MRMIATCMLIGCLVGVSCASLDGKLTLKADQLKAAQGRAALIGTLARVLVPQYTIVLKPVCIAASLDQQKLMVEAVQGLWVEADKTQATVLVETINALVGEIDLQKLSPGAADIKKWQSVLQSLCKGAGYES